MQSKYQLTAMTNPNPNRHSGTVTWRHPSPTILTPFQDSKFQLIISCGHFNLLSDFDSVQTILVSLVAKLHLFGASQFKLIPPRKSSLLCR